MLAMEQVDNGVLEHRLSLALSIDIHKVAYQGELSLFGHMYPFWKIEYTKKYGHRWTCIIAAIVVDAKIMTCPYQVIVHAKPELESILSQSSYAAIEFS
jgi:hypothetical protein